jgi:pimeloyl-ACP methyl ester carboxylesterase
MNESPLILLRGFAREKRHWGSFPSQLSHTLNQPVWALDAPGNGELYRQLSPIRIMDLVEDYRHQLGAAQSGPFHFVALSMGAMVVLAWQERYPEEIASATLINTSLASLSPFYHRLRWRNYPQIVQALCSSPINREKHVMALTSNSPEQHQQALEDWRNWACQAPVSRNNLLRQLWAASRCRLISIPKIPTQLLVSSHDRLVDPRCSHALAKAWKAPIHQHSKAGHDLPLDDPQWTTDQIKRFIAD